MFMRGMTSGIPNQDDRCGERRQMGCRFQPRLRLPSLPKNPDKRASFQLEDHFEGNQMRTTISLIQSWRNAPAILLIEATLIKRSNEPWNIGRPFQSIWRRSWSRRLLEKEEHLTGLAETWYLDHIQRRFANIHASTDRRHLFGDYSP